MNEEPTDGWMSEFGGAFGAMNATRRKPLKI